MPNPKNRLELRTAYGVRYELKSVSFLALYQSRMGDTLRKVYTTTQQNKQSVFGKKWSARIRTQKRKKK